MQVLRVEHPLLTFLAINPLCLLECPKHGRHEDAATSSTTTAGNALTEMATLSSLACHPCALVVPVVIQKKQPAEVLRAQGCHYSGQ
jgi:hypothetical protein